MITRICTLALVVTSLAGWWMLSSGRADDATGTVSADERPAPDDAAPLEGDPVFTTATYMLWGTCAAGSRPDRSAPGGYGASDNMPRPIATEAAKRADAPYLLAQPDVGMPTCEAEGMRVVLVNPTRKTLKFFACDSVIAIVQEARDETGTWRPIEHPPESWCGNSYHHVFLGPGEYWAFFARRYAGPFETTLRFRLVGHKDLELVSNEFEGSVDPGQFVRPEGEGR
jgi:hypothetical protein